MGPRYRKGAGVIKRKIIMKLITFSGPFNHTVRSKKFKLIVLIPTLEFVIDKQAEPYVNGEGKTVDGWDEYSIGFLWLIFVFWIELNIPKRLKQKK